MTINYVTGFAGTGKSTELLTQLLNSDRHATLVLCPTHKAIKVLKDKLDSQIEDVDEYFFSTIHSLLGWIPGINEGATNKNHVEITTKLKKQFPEHITSIIVDEASMMSQDMLMDLTSKIAELYDYEDADIDITLYLDPYQLLPVKATAFEIDPTTTKNLTTQHRVKSKDIAEQFSKFIAYIDGEQTKDLTIKATEHVQFVDSLKGFKPGDRAIAFTNAMVGNMNRQIAKLLNIDSFIGQEVQLGTMLDTIKVLEYLELDGYDLLDLYTREKLILQNSRFDVKYLENNLNTLAKDRDVKFVKGENDLVYAVIEYIDIAYALRNKVRGAAVDAPEHTRERSKAWVKYYTLNRAFTMDYPFASTTHKAQGSEFNTVWIHQADMKKAVWAGSKRGAGNYKNYARLMYVALSRAISDIKIIS